jgi:SAM-dependent methyltransferase
MENNEIRLPSGYGIYEEQGNEMLGRARKEEFNIKNRSFLTVDKYFSQEISGTISEFLGKYPNRKIQVLDLAGGMESQAVKDIVRIKEYGDRVKALNVDFAQNVEKGKGAHRVQGDAANIPLADSSVDIVYSRQFLPFIRNLNLVNREHVLQVKKVLSEVARVLKPGGIAFIDDEEELSGPKSDKKRRELAEEFGVVLQNRDSTNQTLENGKFPNFWNKNVRPQKFLVMRKPEIKKG